MTANTPPIIGHDHDPVAYSTLLHAAYFSAPMLHAFGNVVPGEYPRLLLLLRALDVVSRRLSTLSRPPREITLNVGHATDILAKAALEAPPHQGGWASVCRRYGELCASIGCSTCMPLFLHELRDAKKLRGLLRRLIFDPRMAPAILPLCTHYVAPDSVVVNVQELVRMGLRELKSVYHVVIDSFPAAPAGETAFDSSWSFLRDEFARLHVHMWAVAAPPLSRVSQNLLVAAYARRAFPPAGVPYVTLVALATVSMTHARREHHVAGEALQRKAPEEEEDAPYSCPAAAAAKSDAPFPAAAQADCTPRRTAPNASGGGGGWFGPIPVPVPMYALWTPFAYHVTHSFVTRA